MANEISTRFELKYASGNANFTLPGFNLQIDSTGAPRVYSVQGISTTYEALDFGEVTSNGAFFARNLSAANDVEIGIEVSAAFEPFATLAPGQWAFLPKVEDLFAKASAGTVDLEFALFSE